MGIETPTFIREKEFSPENETLIVGAGLAGSVAALELAKRGQKVILVERRSLDNGHSGNGRSEITLGPVMKTLGTEDAITTPLNTVCFIGLDTGKRFEASLPLAEVPAANVVVAIDHHLLLANLHGKIRSNEKVELQDGRRVERLSENASGVNVVFNDGETLRVSAVVNAAGPSWRSLPFPDGNRQSRYENSVVAVAYGRRCRGEILVNSGNNTMLHPVSVETGKTSWINSCGENGEIEIVFSDYCRRKDVGKVGGKERYETLVKRLVGLKLISIQEEGPPISGFFGLESSTIPTGTDNIYYFGERGCYNAPSIGDAIAPTVRLGPVLADHIVRRIGSESFHIQTQSQFPTRLELAATLTRMNASSAGGALEILKIVKYMDEKERERFLLTHNMPLKYLPRLLAENPALAFTFANITKNFLGLLIRDLGDNFRYGVR